VNAGADAPTLLVGLNAAIAGTNTGLTQSEFFGGPSHNIVWAVGGAHEVDGVVSGGPNGGDKAFTLVQGAGVDTIFGTADDVFTFTLLEHVDNGTGETNTTSLSLAGVFTATDTDGDSLVIDAGATVTIQNDAPTIASAAAASPSPVTTGTTTDLSVLGADDGGETHLTYTWAVTAGPSGATFGVNGANAAKSTTATFTQAGTYTFQVRAYGKLGFSDWSALVERMCI